MIVETLPCGCRSWTAEDGTESYMACRPDCPNFLAELARAKAAGDTVDELHLTGLPGAVLLEDRETLPCGCVVGRSGDSFVIEPCSEGCEYVAYVREQTLKAGKPVHRLPATAIDPKAN